MEMGNGISVGNRRFEMAIDGEFPFKTLVSRSYNYYRRPLGAPFPSEAAKQKHKLSAGLSV
jgi:hypothetical protein